MIRIFSRNSRRKFETCSLALRRGARSDGQFASAAKKRRRGKHLSHPAQRYARQIFDTKSTVSPCSQRVIDAVLQNRDVTSNGPARATCMRASASAHRICSPVSRYWSSPPREVEIDLGRSSTGTRSVVARKSSGLPRHDHSAFVPIDTMPRMPGGEVLAFLIGP